MDEMMNTENMEVSQCETNEVSQVETEEIDTEKQERFFEESKERMSKICQQISFLKKIANKRTVDYTRENIEKMFSYLEQQLSSAKDVFMARLDDSEKTEDFDFDF